MIHTESLHRDTFPRYFGGLFLASRIAPRTPQESPERGRFDSPSLWTLSPNDQRGTTAVAPLWKLPIAVLFQASGLRTALCSGASGTCAGTAPAFSLCRSDSLGGFPKGCIQKAPFLLGTGLFIFHRGHIL